MNAIVFGASGGMGYALVMELVSRGFEVTAFARNEHKLKKLFGHIKEVKIHQGDAMNADEAAEACRKKEFIFHSINIPYPEWADGHPRIMQNLLHAVKQENSRFILADNIYAYGRQSEAVTEDASKDPHTKKGKIRLQLEQMVKSAEIPYLILHFPDYYGPNAENTYIHYTLGQMLQNQTSQFVGSLDLEREYIYTPDGAKAAVELALTPHAYQQNWNIPGAGTMTGNEFVEMVRGATGYSKKVITVKKGMISFIGLFDKMMRESVEMMYLTEKPVLLSGSKYEKEIGPVPRTPYDKGIRAVISSMQKTS
ncbi:SDR family NAD(P)-dependent oxidoreductase [Metabacillus idriensis]|uniref:SDR family NAD(P)-dependent oxidoreductase n=1 Tax=Metabacillus idriensis TaxID=324768 RepID=UPI003D2BC3A5